MDSIEHSTQDLSIVTSANRKTVSTQSEITRLRYEEAAGKRERTDKTGVILDILV
jgi:hypothetical protein